MNRAIEFQGNNKAQLGILHIGADNQNVPQLFR
jgi:hypothetical protein